MISDGRIGFLVGQQFLCRCEAAFMHFANGPSSQDLFLGLFWNIQRSYSSGMHSTVSDSELSQNRPRRLDGGANTQSVSASHTRPKY